jgi:hypothetical protein
MVPITPTTEYEAIYDIVVQLDNDLKNNRVHLRRGSDGRLFDTLDEVVQSLLTGDILHTFSRALISPAEVEV